MSEQSLDYCHVSISSCHIQERLSYKEVSNCPLLSKSAEGYFTCIHQCCCSLAVCGIHVDFARFQQTLDHDFFAQVTGQTQWSNALDLVLRRIQCREGDGGMRQDAVAEDGEVSWRSLRDQSQICGCDGQSVESIDSAQQCGPMLLVVLFG